MEPKNVKMHINIAGEEIALSVAEDRQEFVRRAESNVNELFADWRARFQKRTTQYILAMMAYQYASHFLALCDDYEAARAELQRLESQVGHVLTSS